MATAINLLSDEQNRHLSETYRRAVSQKNRQLLLGLLIVILMLALSAVGAEVDGTKFVKNFWRFPHYFYEITPKLAWATLLPDLAEWFWGLSKWLRQLGETILIAYLGTVTGAIAAFFLGFLASLNLAVGSVSHFIAKRFLEFCRTVPDIVFALIFVVSFGLGPLPGVLAIAIHTTGALGKLFSEVIENIDMKPVDGLKAVGATWRQQVRFAAVPQVLSNFASYSLLRFEINVRGASVMGFVGAGGIGQTLLEYIRKFYYSDVSAVLILMIATVMIIDYGTEKVRHRLVDVEGSR
jgi:phosphonate transport system permease protein